MKHHLETNKRALSDAPTCWQREAPCACLRIETSSHESRLFPYQHLIAASLSRDERGETLRLKYSFHDVEIKGNNLRTLLVALQDFAVKWVRVMPERYQRLEAGENTLVQHPGSRSELVKFRR